MTVGLETLKGGGDIPPEAAIATDKEIKQIIRGKIEAIRGKKPIPLRTVGIRDFAINLFSLTRDECSYLDDGDGKRVRVERERMQEVGFEVMKEFGFDENISKTISAGGLLEGAESGIGIRSYPSQTIEGLSFQRRISYELGADSGICSIDWSVTDKTPFFKVNLGKVLKKLFPIQSRPTPKT